MKLIKYDVEDKLAPLVEFIAIGRDKNLESQLINKSTEPAILKFTPNDAKARFNNTDSLENWYAKGRQIHWLVAKNNELAGIIWYGKSPRPINLEGMDMPEYTFAIRIYDGFSGKGLAKPFMMQSLIIFSREARKIDGKMPAIWLETDIDNPAALAAYSKFGYREISRNDKRVTMILDRNKISEILKI